MALYSTSKGVGSLIEGLNVAYDEVETRGFLLRMMVTLALTALMIAGLITGLIATLAAPAALIWLALPDWV